MRVRGSLASLISEHISPIQPRFSSLTRDGSQAFSSKFSLRSSSGVKCRLRVATRPHGQFYLDCRARSNLQKRGKC